MYASVYSISSLEPSSLLWIAPLEYTHTLVSELQTLGHLEYVALAPLTGVVAEMLGDSDPNARIGVG